MDRQQAVTILERKATIPGDGYTWEQINEAIDMAITALSPPNEPMLIEQLWKIDAPVWLSYNKLNGEKVGYWCLCKYGYIITPSGYGSYINELPDWVFYRRPPEGEEHCYG